MKSKRFNKAPVLKPLIGVLVLLAFIFISGCDLLIPAPPSPPTATPTQTETPTPTIDWFPSTATATLPPVSSPTPQPTLIDQREGIVELLVDDNFTDQSLWTQTQSTSGNVAFGVENLTLAVARPSTALFSISQHPVPTNFYLEITVLTTLCKPADQIGIIFMHETDGDFYRLLLNCAGQYRLELTQGGNVSVLYDWESASRIQPGAPATNRIGLWVDRGDFQLYINDTYQFERRIARDLSGSIGVFSRTISGDAMTARFSNLQIYQVEPE